MPVAFHFSISRGSRGYQPEINQYEPALSLVHLCGRDQAPLVVWDGMMSRSMTSAFAIHFYEIRKRDFIQPVVSTCRFSSHFIGSSLRFVHIISIIKKVLLAFCVNRRWSTRKANGWLFYNLENSYHKKTCFDIFGWVWPICHAILTIKWYQITFNHCEAVIIYRGTLLT